MRVLKKKEKKSTFPTKEEKRSSRVIVYSVLYLLQKVVARGVRERKKRSKREIGFIEYLAEKKK